MRTYRQEITTKGQHSPENLNYYVQDVLKEINHFTSIADIGCGTGFHSNILKQIYPNCKFIGVDFSQATMEYLKDTTIFDQIFLASSKKLPLPDKYTDIAISMENLEHLYIEDVLDALYELKRISKYIIITIPTPEAVINVPWLNKEINEAGNDDIPLTLRDYTCLESCVHKSVIYPESFFQAGFKQIKKYYSGSECYYAESDKIDLTKIRCMGLKKSDNYKSIYLDLLNKSLNLRV